MLHVWDFIIWALRHAAASSVPVDATFVEGATQIASEPWHYLYGSVRVSTDPNTLDRYFTNHYYKKMTCERYNQLTADWKSTDYATDCQGLLDAYLTHVIGEKTDINAQMNYASWCTDKGKISDITRPFVIGEAVFEYNGTKMNHVGWVCGFASDGVPLVVEARSIAYGVVVTRMDKRSWTHRGLMTKRFDYSAKEDEDMIPFEVRKPMLRGEDYKKMQIALNAAGRRDSNGNALEVDGVWGNKSQQAFDSLIAAYAPETVVPTEPEPPVTHTIRLTVDDNVLFEGVVE